ncbi:MAG: aminopeptidase P N-terminal domain-containing protein [Gemmatimonadota bacterium]|jgi:Xaa-Pro aminopeptidase
MSIADPAAGVPASVFQDRRRTVFEALGAGAMVLPSAVQHLKSRDSELPYRPDSELFYVSGVSEPGSVAVLLGGDEPRFALFVRARDPDVELWSGPQLGPDAAADRFGADEVHPMSELSRRLPDLLHSADRIYYRLGRHTEVEAVVSGALARARSRGPRTGTGPRALVDPGEILDEMRLRKDLHEIERLRQAAVLSVEGHRTGMAAAGPGVGEWMVEAEVNATFRRGGGSGPAYETIVGSGPNACVLHYVTNSRVMEEGDLVLLDAGAERALYAGDITRTFPVSGRFTPAQRDLYEVVDRARAESVAMVRPGTTIGAVHDRALRILVDGMVQLGVLSGDADELIETGAYRAFYPHQTSHWLGLDVHDPGDYARRGASRTLEPGMVFTVEPGLYVRPDAEGGAAAFAGTGIRVEDDVLVTEDGCENLTGALPTAPADVEAMVGART